MNNLFLYIVTVLIWGSTFFAIEFQLGTVAPEVSVFYRYVLAAAILFGWCFVTGRSLSFSLRDHGRFFLLGFFLFGINYILTYQAQQYITSALAAISFSSMLWMNMVFSRVFFGTRSGIRVIAGSVFGIAGIIVLFLPQVEVLSLTDATAIGGLLCVAGALSASLGNMVSQGAQQNGLPVVPTNAWGMLYGAIITGIAAAGKGEAFIIDTSPAYLISLLYLAIFGSIVAFGAYLTLLGRIGAHRAGYAMVMFPVIAVLLSFLFEGLELSWNLFAGVVLVIIGNVVILSRSAQPKPAEDSPDSPTSSRRAALITGR